MPDHMNALHSFALAMDWHQNHAGGEGSNNNQPTLWQVRDHLFKVLFQRACVFYSATVSWRLQKVIEYAMLALALSCFGVFCYLHMSFVQVPVTCLERESATWSRDGILRVEISLDERKEKPAHNMTRYVNSTLPEHFSVLPLERQQFLMSLRAKALERTLEGKDEILDAEKSPEFVNRTVPYKDSVSDPDYLSPIKTPLSGSEMVMPAVSLVEKYIVEYSLEFGFLRLSAAARENSTIQVRTVILDPKTDKCFGNKFSRFLLQKFVGYNDILMGSLRYLVEKDNNKGYVRNVVTGEQYKFIDKTTNWTSYFSAGFFMLVFTLTISMLLRYSHHQIFLFVVELLHIFEMNSSIIFPAGPLLTVVLALVGMEAIMSEFFNDSVTAFYIILVVWLADQYDSICCHTALSKRHWLRLFFLYHFGFYAYHYRFNGQYSVLALLTTWLFIQHSMIFFFHRYELPHVMATMEETEGEYDSENVDNEEDLSEDHTDDAGPPQEDDAMARG